MLVKAPAASLHAVEPVLRQPVARGFDRQMGHMIVARAAPALRAASPDRASYARDIRSPDGDRPRRSCRGWPRESPSTAQICAHEGGDRGLAVGAGDGDDDIGLTAVRSAPPCSANSGADWRLTMIGTPGAGLAPCAGDDRRRARRDRLRNELRAIDAACRASAANRKPGLTSRLSAVRPVIASIARAPAGSAASLADAAAPASTLIGSVLRPSAGLACLASFSRSSSVRMRLDAEQRRDARDDLAGRRHRVPARGREAIGLGRRLRLVEHHQQHISRIVHRKGADERGQALVLAA